MNNIKRKILIIGGKGQLGNLFRVLLSEEKQQQVDILEKDDWDQKSSKIKTYDLIIVSTPIGITNSIIKKVSQYIANDTILCDLTSIKASPVEMMLKSHNGPVIGLHPMFGPTIYDTNNQVIICCNGRYPEKSEWFIDQLKHKGFNIIKMEPQQHDKAMDFIQGIEHFITYSLGVFIKESNMDIEELYNISSPIYKLELSKVGRLFAQPAELYYDIIKQGPTRLKIIQNFITHMSLIQKSLTQNNDNFMEKFKETYEGSTNFCDESFAKTDEIIKLGICS